MRVCFVGSSRANAFMTELLEVLAANTPGGFVALDGFPEAQDDLAYVVIPHEFFDTVPRSAWPDGAQLARTVALCVEQPGTAWFDVAFEHARRCGAVMDISPVGIAELRRRGVRAERFALGWCEQWDAPRGGGRNVDVLYMGSASRRRELLLSSYVDDLVLVEHRLLSPPHTPKTEERPDFLLGERKRALLGDAKVMLNVRRQAPPYFEWLRALEAICAGAVLVTEHGAGHAPLVPGEHFVSGSAESLGALAVGLVHDPDRLAAMRDAAYEVVRATPLDTTRLVELAGSLRETKETVSFVSRSPREIDFSDPVMDADTPIFDREAALARAVKRLALESLERRRREAADAVREAGGDPDAIEVAHRSETTADARVTVCVPLYDHAEHVAATLDSIHGDVKILVLDDASTDDSAAVVTDWAQAHPDVDLTLLRRTVNAGLPVARNALAAHAETELVLMLDSDNELLPGGLAKLVAALDADPGALFAYGVLAIHRAGRGDGLLSSLPWEPALLREHNPIDALALLRREELLELGGYTTDPDLHGWEDYDLWCRCAETGRRGAHVPSFVARYRRDAGSMLSVTDIDQSSAREALARRHPALFARVPSEPR